MEKVGDFAEVRQKISDALPQGCVVKCISTTDATCVYQAVLIVPGHESRELATQMLKIGKQIRDYLLPIPERSYEEVQGIYIFIGRTDFTSAKFKRLIPYDINSELKGKQITFEELSKIFKYIPVKYKNKLGFYYDNHIIIHNDVKKQSISDGYSSRYMPEGFADYIKKNTKVQTNKSSFYKSTNETAINYFSSEALVTLCKIKVIDCKESVRLFAFKNEKQEVLNKTIDVSQNPKDSTYQIVELKLKDTVKKSDTPVNTISINGKSRKLRFVLEDVNIIYPNVNGWKPSKDPTILSGCEVKIKDNRNFRLLEKNTTVVVENIKTVGNKKYIGFNHNNKLIYDNLKNFKLK